MTSSKSRARVWSALVVPALLGCGGGVGSPPRLIVLISVDQMRADYLDRFADLYVGGLARLRETGAVFVDGHQDHALTETAAGHATISTGVFPSRHGIVSNDWYDRTAQRGRYSVEDADTPIVGFPDDPGRSPTSLLRTTVGDWLKAASVESKVFSVSVKDRSAILLAGHEANAAYWYHPRTGRFVSSTHYMESYPGWVDSFHVTGATRYFGTEWTKLLPDSAYERSREDAFESEFDGQHTVFPHAIGPAADEPGPAFYTRLLYTPFADELTLSFARTMLVEEGLGVDDTPDLLLVGLSAADYVGHAFGPYSQEVQDYYLRLDRFLADFFDALDSTVGTGEYAIVFSADHGVLPMPEELARRGIDSRRVGPDELEPAVSSALDRAVGDGVVSQRPRLQRNRGLVIDYEGQPVAEADAAVLRALIAEYLTTSEAVAAAFTYEQLAAGDQTDSVMSRFERSFRPDRAPDIMIRLRENLLLTSQSTFTSHGSDYWYDTHVPIVFWGPGIRAGRHDGRRRTVDIAPTLAVLAGIVPPGDLDGTVLREVVP